jgi:hypothetical protein
MELLKLFLLSLVWLKFSKLYLKLCPDSCCISLCGLDKRHAGTIGLSEVRWYHWAYRFVKTTRYISCQNSASWSQLYHVGMYWKSIITSCHLFYWHGLALPCVSITLVRLFCPECRLTKTEKYWYQESRCSHQWSCFRWCCSSRSRGMLHINISIFNFESMAFSCKGV